MKKLFTIVGLLLFAAVVSAQTTPVQDFIAGGVSYNNAATPSVAGSAIYAHLLNDGSGTYAFTSLDALPNTLKPFTVTTNVGVGVAQQIASFGGGKYTLWVPTAAGISWNGSNTGWQWNGGGMLIIPLKNSFYLAPNVRFLKSSVSGGSGYQLMPGLAIGWGRRAAPAAAPSSIPAARN